MTKFSCILLILCIVGCETTKTSWVNYDNNKSSQQFFDKDWADCKIAGYDKFGLGSTGFDNTPPAFWDSCMMSKGWKKI